MSDTLSLFDRDTFYASLQSIIDTLIKERELPENSIHLYSNISSKGKNAGKETSKSICIFEPDYPPNPNVTETPGRNYMVLRIESMTKNGIKLAVRDKQYNAIEIPAGVTDKVLKSNPGFHHLTFNYDNVEIFNFIKDNIIYCLANYESSNSFSCCSRFIQCSDAKKCVHDNKIYAMGCKYRINLDAGKIFYGKNKNI